MKTDTKAIKINEKEVKSIKKIDNNKNKNKKEKTNYNKPFKLEMSFDEAVSRVGKIKVGKREV